MRRALWLALLASGCGRQGQEPAPSEHEAPVESEPDARVQREASTHYAAAAELETRGEYAAALEAVERSLAVAPTRDARMLGARIAITLGEDAKAQAWTDAVIAAHPQDALAHYNRGLIAQRADLYNDARTAYIAALRIQPNLADARYNLALLAWSEGAKDEARHHVARFLESFPDDPRGPRLRRLISP